MTTAQRVAARHVLAAFIPDTFFKGYEAELKKLLAEPLSAYPLNATVWFISEKLNPLLERLRQEIFDTAPVARDAINRLVNERLEGIEKTRAIYAGSSKALNTFWSAAKSTPEHVTRHIVFEINQRVRKDLKTFGKALKTPVTIDVDGIRGLATRALKKATPEELAGIGEDFNTPAADAFFANRVDGGIARLIKRGKAEGDLVTWLATVRATLANYAVNGGRFLEFDLNGLKVVVDDWSVSPSDHDKYVKYLDAAYHLLKRKKLERAWYGTAFIQCEKCGGEPNVHGDVGGSYTIGKDVIEIHSRPTDFIIELMVHELGHRYWFKNMSQDQRAKFKALVLIRDGDGERPGGERKLLDLDQIENARENVHLHRNQTLRVINQCENEIESGKSTVDQVRKRVGGERYDIEALEWFALEPTRDLDSRGDALYKEVKQAVEAACTALVGSPALSDYQDPSVQRVWKEWFAGCREMVQGAAAATLGCIDHAVKSYKEREVASRTPEQVAWDEDPRAVLPVSVYGATHIQEAFAEAFMFYVMGMKMNADQEASFKSVLLNQDRTATKVAARWRRSVV